MESMKWQPIETAPKDGTRILVFGIYGQHGEDYDYRRPEMFVTCWVDDDDPLNPPLSRAGWWLDNLGEVDASHPGPTHWMPLPAPPIEAD